MSASTDFVSLNGDWLLHYGPQQCAAEGMPSPEIPELFESCPAVVPGNVELDLIAAGVLPADLDRGDNIYSLIDYEHYQWWYVKDFDLPSHADFADPYLCLDGIDTLATIWLNKCLVGKTDNMLVPHRFPVLNQLREGRNRITVAIDSPILAATRIPVDPGCYAMENNWESLHIRKAAHSYGWDIMPRIISAGIWRDIFVRDRQPVEFEDVYLATLKVDRARQRTRFLAQWVLRDRSGATCRGTVTIRISEPNDDSIIHEAEIPALSWVGRYESELSGIQHWYPRGSGKPRLYRISLTYRDHNCAPIASWNSRFGFRTIELRMSDLIDAAGSGEFRFVVNGQEVFIKGSNWVPVDAFHSRDVQRMDETLALAIELDCNMIRCWGGNVYEPQAFFDFCDENGILVWQDFSLACALYPQTSEFHAKMRREAEAIVPRLRNHPSLALWAGNNEIDQFYLFAKQGVNPNEDDKISREVLAGVCRRMDPYRTYLPSSPYISPALWEEGIDNNAPEDHLWGPRDDFKSPYYTRSTACFASEIGYHGCPSRASLERMMRPENLWPWPGNEDWLTHCIRPQPASTRYNYRIPLMATQIANLFGSVPESLDHFILASQISQAEALKYFVEKFRIDKGRTGGLLWWNIRDGWPQISDSVVDYYGEKKLAFHLLKALHAPVHVMLGEPQGGRHAIVAVNDAPVPVSLSLQVCSSGIARMNTDAVLPENGCLYLGEMPAPDSFEIFTLEWTTNARQGQSHYLAGPRPFPLPDLADLYHSRFGQSPSVKQLHEKSSTNRQT